MPTALCRGSTISAAPKRLAATMAAPICISPWVKVGPSSMTRTRLPLISPSRVSSESASTTTAFGAMRWMLSPQDLQLLRAGGIHLVDHHHVGHPQVRLAGIVAHLVAGPQRIDHHDLQIGLIEGHVVVAAVEQDHVGIVPLLGHAHDRLVIDAGIDDVSGDDVRLVLFHLLDRAVVSLEVLDLGETLDLLGLEIAVGHRVADGDDPLLAFRRML